MQKLPSVVAFVQFFLLPAHVFPGHVRQGVNSCFKHACCLFWAENEPPWLNITTMLQHDQVGIEHENVDRETHETGVQRGTWGQKQSSVLGKRAAKL